ncbi:MAG: RelA/SpoT family protein, partial [Paramuribaculum sp.]|nr:RelA/SpoT family protein [Paramuribaculum sp.]
SRARNKIRQALNEISNRAIEIAKETLSRRFKNRKIEPDEGLMMKLIKRMGYKTVTDFYRDIADDKLQVNEVISVYEKLLEPEESTATVSAEEFSLQTPTDSNESPASDVLVIGDGSVKGVNYKLARCCNPIYGDKVFGFISSEGVIKIHREDCSNAAHIRKRYPYRIITTKWSGKVGSQFVTTLTVLGTDDIGIVTNISSLITKQNGASLRAIAIDSYDGLFQGNITIGVEDKKVLDALIKKISTVKGVKNVQRNN